MHELLDTLKKFPSSSVYNLAPKQYVVRGFNYYREGRLIDIRWTDDDSFTATVKGSHLYSVAFFLRNGTFTHACTCPAWSRQAACKHVLCAIFTIKNLLQPESFRLPKYDDGYRESLLERLEGHAAVNEVPLILEPTFSLMLTKGYYGVIDISIERTGYTKRPPKELQEFESYRYYGSDIKSRILLRYLETHADRYQIYLKINEEKIPVVWDSSMRTECKTAVDISNGNITVEKLCIDNSVICRDIYLIGKWVFDLKEKRFGLISSTDAWNLFNEIRELTYNIYETEEIHEDMLDDDKNKFTLPLNVFQKIQFVSPISERDAVLKNISLTINGEDTAISNGKHSYRLTVGYLPGNNDICILEAECILDNIKSAPTKKLFSIFSDLSRGLNVSHALAAQKRQAVIYKTFFEMTRTNNKTEADRIMKDNISSGDFGKSRLRAEAKRLLIYYYSIYKAKEERLQFDGDKWRLVPIDKEKEAMLYRIPFELFGWKIFRDTYFDSEMTVPASRFYESLGILYERLKAEGIELSLEGNPVEEARWDISFDATAGSGIDWFELRPEIRCNGEIIDDSAFLNAITQKGFVKKDGFIQILDENTAEALKLMGSIYGRTSNKTGRKDVIIVPRLQILDWIYLRSKGIRLKLLPEDEAVLNRLMSFERIEKNDLPKLKVKLRGYQEDGYNWLSFLYEHRFGACLADDM
ncbi:MAG: hypothetical protein HY754_00710, partial [Nitrospirae bacterium]|nr:hypothetical protein [Nitrospirota bacterium]